MLKLPHQPTFWKCLMLGIGISISTVNLATADIVTVNNHSFEADSVPANSFITATPTGWLGGGGIINGTFGGFNTGGITDNPDGTDQATWSNDADIYQVTGHQLTAGSVLTLTVDVGERPDSSLGGTGAIRLGVGSAFGVDVMTPTVLNADLVVTTNNQNGWFTQTVMFAADDQPVSFLGQNIRIELVTNPGSIFDPTQINYDNVRLLTTVPEPASFIAIALVSVVGCRRRR